MARYVVAAFFARGADSGAAVGFVLLAASRPSATSPELSGALLAAALTAPHVLGPLSAKILDRVSDERRILAAASAIYGAAVLVATLTFGEIPLVGSLLLVAVAGFCGPLLTGGLSSTLAPLAAPDERAQRRAQSWDALTYGIGGTLGPAAVALVSTLTDASLALACLAVATFVAAAVTLTLPKTAAAPSTSAGAHTGILRTLAQIGPLRRTTLLTMAASFSAGAVAVIAVAFSTATTGDASNGALLVAAFGIGNLVGSLALTAFPLRGEAERNMMICTALVAAAFAACAVAPSYVALIVLLAVAGALNAPFFAATLAVRSDYSPDAVRGQAFTAMAGFKVACGSAGTALAGLTIGLGAPTLFVAGGALIAVMLGGTMLDRRLSTSRVGSGSGGGSGSGSGSGSRGDATGPPGGFGA